MNLLREGVLLYYRIIETFLKIFHKLKSKYEFVIELTWTLDFKYK